jgi:ankyrin repeat protein
MDLPELLGRSLINELTSRHTPPNMDVIKSLLKLGADINYIDEDGNNVLSASIYKDDNLFNFLIESGADINIHNDKKSTVLVELINAIQFEKHSYKRSNSKDHVNRCKTFIKRIKKLIYLGVDLNVKCKIFMFFGLNCINNQTALMVASKLGVYEIVELLIYSGADLTLKDDDGCNFIDLANTIKGDLRKYSIQRFILAKEPTLYKSFIKNNIKISSKTEKEFPHLKCVNGLNLI